MKIFYLLLCCILSTEGLLAQGLKDLTINVSYFGESITHPGLKVGIEHSLWENSFQKTTSKGNQFNKKQSLFLSSNVGFYHHRRFHTALFVNGELGYRKVKKRGFKAEMLVGVGIMRTFLSGNTFSVLENGEIELQRGAGQYGFMPSLAVAFGKDLSFTKNRNWAFHIKPSIYFQVPYNHTILPHFALETGITYAFKSKPQ